jgi:hypothetical protein
MNITLYGELTEEEVQQSTPPKTDYTQRENITEIAEDLILILTGRSCYYAIQTLLGYEIPFKRVKEIVNMFIHSETDDDFASLTTYTIFDPTIVNYARLVSLVTEGLITAIEGA